jgi:hypothetical protein
MLRYLPAAIELVGLVAATIGSFLLNPALGVIAGGLSAVAIGYALEDAK